MKDRRKYERYDVSLPTKLELIESTKTKTFNLRTINISSTGAFLLTREGFSKDTRCRLEVTVPSGRIKELTGAQSLIKVEGTIVRSTSEGVAICFDGDCQILGLKGS